MLQNQTNGLTPLVSEANVAIFVLGGYIRAIFFDFSCHVPHCRHLPHTYQTAVINTLVHNGRENRVQKAEQILRRMILPDKLAYSCVIHAWSQSREKGAALQADRLLMELYDVAHSLVVNEERDEDDNHHNLDWIDTGSNKDDRCHSKGRTPLQPPDATTIAAVIHS